VVSVNRAGSASRPTSSRPKVESPTMRGGPCLPGVPRC
jgi:hypothetical protein